VPCGRTTPPGTRPPAPPKRRNPIRRRQWYACVTKAKLAGDTARWLLLLGGRSDDTAKPVWGRQTRMAEELTRCERSVRNYRLAAEQAGLIRTYRADPQRHPTTGRWFRPRSNTYVLVFPTKSEGEPAEVDVRQERVENEKAQLSPSGKSLPDNPCGGENPPREAGSGGGSSDISCPSVNDRDEAPPAPNRERNLAGIAAARQVLSTVRGP
jgi:hypothetical protein